MNDDILEDLVEEKDRTIAALLSQMRMIANASEPGSRVHALAVAGLLIPNDEDVSDLTPADWTNIKLLTQASLFINL